MPLWTADRALLEKLADVAARTSKHEVGNIFRTEERRPILVPVHVRDPDEGSPIYKPTSHLPSSSRSWTYECHVTASFY